MKCENRIIMRWNDPKTLKYIHKTFNCGDYHNEFQGTVLCEYCSQKTSHTKCNHNWEEHGCAPPIKKYFICTKCGEERLER